MMTKHESNNYDARKLIREVDIKNNRRVESNDYFEQCFLVLSRRYIVLSANLDRVRSSNEGLSQTVIEDLSKIYSCLTTIAYELLSSERSWQDLAKKTIRWQILSEEYAKYLEDNNISHQNDRPLPEFPKDPNSSDY